MENENKIDIESISKLTDEELFRELRKNGLKTGPITSTTRFLYEKRLRHFIDPSSAEQEASSEQTPEVSSMPQLKQEVGTISSSITVEPISKQVQESPKKVKVTKESPNSSPKPTQKQSPKSSPVKNFESPVQESANSSPETYLNTSGIRGRAPLRRQNSEAKVQSTTDDLADSKKNGSSFVYFILAVILALAVYIGLIYLKDTTNHSVEF